MFFYAKGFNRACEAPDGKVITTAHRHSNKRGLTVVVGALREIDRPIFKDL